MRLWLRRTLVLVDYGHSKMFYQIAFSQIEKHRTYTIELQRMTETDFHNYVESLVPPSDAITNFGLTIKNVNFIDSFSYTDNSIPLHFENCRFEDKFSLVSFLPSIDIYFTNCEFLKTIFFWKVKTSKKIMFLDCRINHDFILNECEINFLQLNNKYIKQLIFSSDCSFNTLEIGGKNYNEINKIYMPASIIKNYCILDQANISSLRISYSTLEKQLNIFNCNIDNLELDNFRNNGYLRFLNCKAKSSSSLFEISRSNLGKAEFFEFNFSSFKQVNISNSVIFDCLYINSVWGKNIVCHYNQQENFDKKIYHSKMRDIYKQIKFAMSKQGNIVEEQHFHGLEMNSYCNSLSFYSDFWTKTIIKLSFLTSNYGQSIFRPLLVLIINCFIIFYLKSLLGHNFSYLKNISFDQFFQDISSYLWYLNPLHKNDPELVGLPFILDMIVRIISSYSIYNIVRASRRFIK